MRLILFRHDLQGFELVARVFFRWLNVIFIGIPATEGWKKHHRSGNESIFSVHVAISICGVLPQIFRIVHGCDELMRCACEAYGLQLFASMLWQ
jgi:hypothetical protein